MRRYSAAFMICLLLLISGCTVRYDQKVNFEISEPLRVAVLPFMQRDSRGEIVQSEYVVFQRPNLPDREKNKEDPPARNVQQIALSELRETSLDIVPPNLVTAHLVHHGFVKEFDFDYQKILDTSPQALCDMLVCDALLYGEILEWSQTYYAIQSVSTVRLRLKLVRASDGAVLYESDSQDSDSRGLTKGPTGYTSLVLEPLKGLREGVILDLAKVVVSKALAPLQVKDRPEVLDSPRPAIFAATHNGREGKIDPHGSLVVLMTGSEAKSGSFSIGNFVENIPMIEVDAMHYMGEYFPLDTDTFSTLPVTVQLMDKYGRTTTQNVDLGPVSLR